MQGGCLSAVFSITAISLDVSSSKLLERHASDILTSCVDQLLKTLRLQLVKLNELK